ncbi:hypothetical protein KEM48_011026 [Puccinia striiformis f. sp. tritici PST-130]|nr:hypothetical protein KEM48_011026 [Puccinia striiformis f. sp. tritici PST-130]
MSTDIVMEEEQGNTSQHLTEKKTSSKKRKSIATEPTGDSTENTTTEPASKKKEKKNKGKQDATTTEDADNETTSKKKKSKQTTNNDTENDADQNVNLDALSPIAHPLADKKLSKRVLRTVKKGSKQRRIKRGVKEVVKALRKGEKGLVVMAGDISPMDVLTHIPLLAEENGSGYIFVPTKESLGAASSTKRPTSCVMISTSRGGSEAMQKKFAEKKKALIAADPTKAAKIQADEDEYTTSFDAVLGEVLRLAAATSNRAGLPALATTSTVPNIQHLMYISTSMGLSLLFSAWIFFRATGAAFNPGSLMKPWFIRNTSPQQRVFSALTNWRHHTHPFHSVCRRATSASLVASSILKKLLPGPMSVVPNLAVGTSIKQGLLIEAFITCALVLSVLFLAVEKHRATYLAPVGISITLFACHLFGVVYTGAAMNSARAFGPAAVTGAWKDHWVYWVGPTIGSLLAVIIYVFMKRFEYWRSNEGQDTDVFSASPELFIARPVAGDGRPRLFSMSKSAERVRFPTEQHRQGSDAFAVDPQQGAEPV